MNSYVNSFLEYLRLELNYSAKTINTYEEALKKYSLFLATKHYSFNQINKDQANQYKAYLVSLGYESKTSSLYLSTVRSFYHYLVEIKSILINPFATIKNPKVIKKLPNFLNHSERDEMLHPLTFKSTLDYRNLFIIEFLYATGLRVSELCNVKLQDLDFKEKTLRVMGKGNKERIVFYEACDPVLFDLYIKKIRKELLNGLYSDYLLTSKTGKLSVRSVEQIVKKYALKNNILNKVTPHTLRHTFATDLLNEGADIRSVGELLGHESLSTTQIYTHITADHLKNIYQKTHPRSKK